MKFKLHFVDQYHYKIVYKTKNKKNEIIFYCLQYDGLRDGIQLYRCDNKEFESEYIVELKDDESAIDYFEKPTGHSELELKVIDWINNN